MNDILSLSITRQISSFVTSLKQRYTLPEFSYTRLASAVLSYLPQKVLVLSGSWTVTTVSYDTVGDYVLTGPDCKTL